MWCRDDVGPVPPVEVQWIEFEVSMPDVWRTGPLKLLATRCQKLPDMALPGAGVAGVNQE